MKSLTLKINKQFERLQARLSTILQSQKNTVEQLIEETNKSKGANSHIIKDLSGRSNGIQEQIEQIQNDLNTAIENSMVSTNFNYLCFFGALYSILILIANGFKFQLETKGEILGLFLFDFYCIVILIYVFKEKKMWLFRWLVPTYNAILGVIVVGLMLTLPSIFLIPKYLHNIYIPKEYGWIIQTMSILLPTSHFFYYFVQCARNTRSHSRIFNIRIGEIQSSCEEFSKEVQITFATINKMKISPA